MKIFKKRVPQEIGNWSLESNSQGELLVGGVSTVELAEAYQTPLHVVNKSGLEASCRSINHAFGNYNGKVSIHFAFKCNPVPAIIRIIKDSGINAEVMSSHELKLALSLGFKGKEIVVNGPHKNDSLLKECLEAEVRAINVDSLEELTRLNRLAAGRNKKVNVLLRINPDYIPAGMNSGSATSSRKNSLFGLDLKSGEVQQALELIKRLDSVNFKGYHFHIGTGILDPKDYYKVLKQLRKLIRYTFENDNTIELFDIGGGFGVATSREMTAAELIYIQAFGRLPNPDLPVKNLSFDRFFQSINTALKEIFIDYPFPELIIEPGRSIVSSNQLLLVRICDVKSRKGIKKWVITDAGIGTAVMPVYYEFHEIVLCNDVNRIHNEIVTITGPGCFAADIIYKDYRLPNVHPGEYLAVMDSGAYFTSWESNFGYPRPAIAVADSKKHTLIRDRENFDHMVQMDNY